MTDDLVNQLQKETGKMLAEQDKEFNQKTNALIERHSAKMREATDEIERLRTALHEITNSPNELRNATPSDYARGFNDGRWRMQQIARAALSPPVQEQKP